MNSKTFLKLNEIQFIPHHFTLNTINNITVVVRLGLSFSATSASSSPVLLGLDTSASVVPENIILGTIQNTEHLFLWT